MKVKLAEAESSVTRLQRDLDQLLHDKVRLNPPNFILNADGDTLTVGTPGAPPLSDVTS